MKCRLCKTELLENSDICPNCGSVNFDRVNTVEDINTMDATVVSENIELEEKECSNNLVCPNCSTKLEDDWKYCPNCKSLIIKDSSDDSKIYITWYCIFLVGALLSFFLCFFKFNVGVQLFVLLNILAFLIVIAGKIKNPNAHSMNVVFIFSIFIFIFLQLPFISFMILLYSCYGMG